MSHIDEIANLQNTIVLLRQDNARLTQRIKEWELALTAAGCEIEKLELELERAKHDRNMEHVKTAWKYQERITQLETRLVQMETLLRDVVAVDDDSDIKEQIRIFLGPPTR